jgi:hypothetical protein
MANSGVVSLDRLACMIRRRPGVDAQDPPECWSSLSVGTSLPFPSESIPRGVGERPVSAALGRFGI